MYMQIELDLSPRWIPQNNANVTNSRTGRRISHGYNPASFVAIRIGPYLSVLHPYSYVVVLNHTYIMHQYRTTEIGISRVIREI